MALTADISLVRMKIRKIVNNMEFLKKLLTVKDKLLDKITNALDEPRKLSSKEYLNYAEALSFLSFFIGLEELDDEILD